MKTGKLTEDQIVKILEEGEKSEETVEEVCRKHGIHKQTYYGWRKKYGGLNTTDLQRMRQLEQENGRLKRALADAMVDNQVLTELNAKKW